MKYDRISAADYFFIYGAGLQGRKICDNLMDVGLRVSGFLDNSDFVTSSYRGVDILPYRQVHNLPESKKTAIVVISLINPFEHEKIKDSLLKNGFSRIICKRDILKKENTYQINALYDKISSFQGNLKADTIIGAEFEMWDSSENCQEDQGIINRQNGYVTAYIPIELIYAVGKPIIMQTQVITLFECFQGKNTKGIDLFWEYVCKTQEGLPKTNLVHEKQRIISGRFEVYQNMVQALSLDPDFFRRHPVTVNRNGAVFDLKDGMHRSLFLYIHGHRFIPCSMPEYQYDTWLARESAKEKQNVFTPILHPYHYLDQTAFENIYQTRIDTILRFLADKDITGCTAFDFGNNDGWVSRNLCRAGMQATCLTNDEDKNVISAINHLECLDDIDLNTQFSPHCKFDIVTYIDLKQFEPITCDKLQKITSLATQFVFIELSSLDYLDEIEFPYEILKKSFVSDPLLITRYLIVIKIEKATI